MSDSDDAQRDAIVETPDRLLPVIRARERVFRDGVVSGAVREEIRSSWVRSLSSEVPREPEYHFESDLDLDSKLCRAARRVFDRLAYRLAGTGTSLFLASQDALVLERWVDTPDLARALDKANSIPGAALAECLVGTNGIGTVAETGRPLLVTGAEHWAEGYQDLSCAGAPILNPVTRRLEGVLTIACEKLAEHPVILSMVHQSASDIERELLETASGAERALLDAFLSATRRSNRAVLAASAGVVITTPAASRVCGRIDQALLWEQISDAQQTRRDVRATFTDGAKFVDAHIQPRGGRGVVVEFHERRARPSRQATARSLLPQLIGQSDAWHSVSRDVLDAVEGGGALAVCGEPGTGKVALVRAAYSKFGRNWHFFDAALEPIDGTARWIDAVRSRVCRRDLPVVIRHVDRLSEQGARALHAIVEASDVDSRAQVVATAQSARAPLSPHADLIHSLGAKIVEVPPLRERRDDIVPLSSHFGSGRRWSNDAQQVLLRQDWPGNVRELRALVQGIGGNALSPAVTLQDLPSDVRCRSASRQMTRIEEVEVAALLAALKEAGGNKSRAAEILGGSRSTVYRKLASSGTDFTNRVY